MSKFILDTRLGNDHYVICTEAIHHGVIEPEDLNEGRRTMKEQWFFWNHQPPKAAFPSPLAPHIRAGRNDHAIDANSFNGAVNRLASFYRSLGVEVFFEVPGEAWHFRPHDGGVQLRRAADKIRRQRDAAVLHKGESETAVKFLKHQLHVIENPRTGKPYFKPLGSKPPKGWSKLFDGELEDSVKNFQHDHNLTVDGRVGKKTNRKIDKAYAKARKKNRASAKERAKERQAAAERGEL